MTSVYKVRFSNNASTTLAAGIANNSPSLQVLAGSGALFPILGNNEAFVCTLVKNGSPTIREIVLVTGHTSGSDNFTGLVRNLSGTGALAWNAGDIVELRPTAESMSYFAQFTDLQAQNTNYAADVGSANSYKVILSPQLNGRVVGMPIRWKAAHDNTGFSQFDDGFGGVQLRTSQNQQLLPGDVVANGIYESIWDGTYYRLVNVRTVTFSQVLGSIGSAQVPLSVIAQWESSLAISFGQMSDQIRQSQILSSINLPGSPTTTTASVGDSSAKIATTDFLNKFVRRGIVHVGDVVNPVGGSVTFSPAFATPPVVVVSLIDANNHGASAVAGIDGIPTINGFNWAAREIASAIEDAYIHWIAVAT